MQLPLADTEDRILTEVEQTVLDADVFDEALEVAVSRLTADTPSRAVLLSERDRLDREFRIWLRPSPVLRRFTP